MPEPPRRERPALRAVKLTAHVKDRTKRLRLQRFLVNFLSTVDQLDRPRALPR